MAKTAPNKPKTGAPSKFNDAVGIQICELIAEGYTLRQVSKIVDISKASIISWTFKEEPQFKAFLDRYMHAIKLRQELWAEDIIDIADNGENDWYEKEDKTGRKVISFDKDAYLRCHLRIEARKWLLAKSQPKRFGDQSKLELSGPNGGPVASVNVPAPIDRKEWLELYGKSLVQ